MTRRSELETIGQRLTTRLKSCQLLSSIEVEPQEESLVLTLQPIATLALSPRIMRFCLNFLGAHKHCAQQTELFCWCTTFVEHCDLKTCRIWIDCRFPCGYEGFDVLAELILLGFKLSSGGYVALDALREAIRLSYMISYELPQSASTSNLSDLFQVYRTPEEVLSFYEGFVAHVIAEEDDLPTETCDPQLYARSLCCPKHRRLLLQRLLLNHWLHHLFEENDHWEPDQSEIAYVSVLPTLPQIQTRLNALLDQTLSPQAWLEAYFAYKVQAEQEDWDRPTRSCSHHHFMSFACCPFHTAMMAFGYLWNAWLEHFDDCYHMRDMRNGQSRGKIALSSITGIALLIREAHLDSTRITFTAWFAKLPEKDVSGYYSFRDLPKVTQSNDYTWRAVLPELPMMWQTGHSADEAVALWQREYDQPDFAPLFASLLQERAAHTPLVRDEPAGQHAMQRPPTVEFPYRGELYRMETNEGLPKRHIVLSNGTILVVCGWNGRIPALLSDIHHSPEPMPPHRIAEQLDALEAFAIPLPPGRTTQAMAILDWQGQRYAVDNDSHALVKMPDERLYRVHTLSNDGEPVHIAEIIPFDPEDSYMPYQLEHFGTTPAIPMPPDYPGMAHAPRDLRIRFSYHGESFILSHETYEDRKGIVFIPDHGYFRIGGYLESMPVKLAGLEPLTGSSPASEEVAVALRLADAVDVESWVPDEQKV